MPGMLPPVVVYCLVVVVGLWCWFQWRHRELLRLAVKIPTTAPTWPLLGHAYSAFWKPEGFSKFLLDMTIKSVEKGLKIFCYWIGPLPLLIITGADEIQMILNQSSALGKPDEYLYFQTGIEETTHGTWRYSLITAPVNIWKVTRRHMNLGFHPRNIQHMVPVFNRNCREMVEGLRDRVGQGPVNFFHPSMSVGLKTVCNMVFGPDTEIDVNSQEFLDLMSVVELVPELFIKQMLWPWLRIEAIYKFFYKYEVEKIKNTCFNFTENRIKVTKQNTEQKLNGSTATTKSDGILETDGEEPLNVVDVFSIMQQSNPQYKEADLRNEILGLYCTGTDTIGTATSSCLLALAQYQDIQERLYQEIVSVVGPDDDVTIQDLSRMPYLEQVLNETLRRFVIVPFILRKTTVDFNFKINKIPANSTIALALASIHMDPKYYPDPLKFDPDRFAQENIKRIEKFPFLPFSGGPRNCIAKNYAMHLLKILVVHVLRQFRLSTQMDIHKLKMKLMVTMTSLEGYNISLERRK